MRLRSKTFIFLLFFALAAVAAYRGDIWNIDSSNNKRKKDETKIAVVNGENIYLWEFESKIKNWKNLYPYVKDGGDDNASNKVMKLVLEKLIEERLIQQESKRLNLVVTFNELESALNDYVSGYEAEDLRALLNKERITMDSLRARISYNLIVKKLSAKVIERDLSVSEEDVMDYYKRNIKEFYMPRQVRALQIVVLTKKDAEDIRREILQGADFAEIARKRSIALEADKGGDLGFFEAGLMPEEFDRVIFKMKVGEVSPVIKTAYGFHLFKLAEKKPRKRRDRKEAFSLIRKRILDERRDRAFRKWKKELIERSDIKIVEWLI